MSEKRYAHVRRQTLQTIWCTMDAQGQHESTFAAKAVTTQRSQGRKQAIDAYRARLKPKRQSTYDALVGVSLATCAQEVLVPGRLCSLPSGLATAMKLAAPPPGCPARVYHGLGFGQDGSLLGRRRDRCQAGLAREPRKTQRRTLVFSVLSQQKGLLPSLCPFQQLLMLITREAHLTRVSHCTPPSRTQTARSTSQSTHFQHRPPTHPCIFRRPWWTTQQFWQMGCYGGPGRRSSDPRSLAPAAAVESATSLNSWSMPELLLALRWDCQLTHLTRRLCFESWSSVCSLKPCRARLIKFQFVGSYLPKRATLGLPPTAARTARSVRSGPKRPHREEVRLCAVAGPKG